MIPDLTIRNTIEECADGRIVERSDPDLLVVHRLSFAKDNGGEKPGGSRFFDDVEPIADHMLDGPLLSARFRDKRRVFPDRRHWADRPGSYTGGEVAYSFVGRTDGVIDQCLPVRELGYHAQRWSIRGLSIAVVGDHRLRRPTPGQWAAVVSFGALWLAAGVSLWGHTELPEGSSDPLKQCPGSYLDMDTLRGFAYREAREHLDAGVARARLLELGVVF